MLVEEVGEVAPSALPPLECVAMSTDGSKCLAMLLRRKSKRLNALNSRVDKAICLA